MSTYYRNLSLILSRVMDDITVNEVCVMKRRRQNLMQENCMDLCQSIEQTNITQHVFGSQTEGTTTPGLQSDTDLLVVSEDFIVITDWKDWVPGKINHLMVQDELSFPGYCRLQALRHDMPLPMSELPDDKYTFDEIGRVILKNKCLLADSDIARNGVHHGPALNSNDPAFKDIDFVFALSSQTLPSQYKDWSSRERPSNWPTPEMIQCMETTKCFVVPCAHRLAEWPDRDWRISTSLAERFLMFSLNITQIRCYVILKMIIKTFIEPHVPDVISSYICKTLLFHSLDRTGRDFWVEENLLQCVNQVLLYMLAAVHTMDCPNYFNESANLLFGKIDYRIQAQLLHIIRELVQSRGGFLLRIGFDNLNSRLTRYIIDRNLMISFDENDKVRTVLCMMKSVELFAGLHKLQTRVFLATKIDEASTYDLVQSILDFSKCSDIQRRAAVLWLPLVCSYLATVDASTRISRGQNISHKSLHLYKLSFMSDVASSRLKYASFLYCTGQFIEAVSVLQYLERRITPAVISVCDCLGKFICSTCVLEKGRMSFPFRSHLAVCVMFTRAERQCCPREMQFEFNRSSIEEKFHRHKHLDAWMDMAVLDCLPYLYYLQYITARQLGQRDLQSRALHELESRVCDHQELLGHRETGYNVLGQCFELENNVDRALMYYIMSLQERPTNNAVRWHLTRLGFDVNRYR